MSAEKGNAAEGSRGGQGNEGAEIIIVFASRSPVPVAAPPVFRLVDDDRAWSELLGLRARLLRGNS